MSSINKQNRTELRWAKTEWQKTKFCFLKTINLHPSLYFLCHFRSVEGWCYGASVWHLNNFVFFLILFLFFFFYFWCWKYDSEKRNLYIIFSCRVCAIKDACNLNSIQISFCSSLFLLRRQRFSIFIQSRKIQPCTKSIVHHFSSFMVCAVDSWQSLQVSKKQKKTTEFLVIKNWICVAKKRMFMAWNQKENPLKIAKLCCCGKCWKHNIYGLYRIFLYFALWKVDYFMWYSVNCYYQHICVCVCSMCTEFISFRILLNSMVFLLLFFLSSIRCFFSIYGYIQSTTIDYTLCLNRLLKEIESIK